MKRALFAASLAAAAALSPAARADETSTRNSARNETRLDPQSIGVPGWGLIFEGGAKDQKLTGRGALRVGPFTFDLSLAGATQSSSSQRSALFDTAGKGAGGSLSAGVTWTNFSIHDDTLVRTQLDKELCPLQAKLDKEKGDAALAAVQKKPDTDEGYDKALKARQKLAGEIPNVTLVKKNADEEAKIARKAEEDAQAKYDGLAKAASDLAAQLESAPAARRDELSAQAQAATIRAHGAATEALQARAARIEADRKAALQESRFLDATRALHAAGAAVEKEEERIRGKPSDTCAYSKLDPTLQARVHWPFRPTFLARLQGGVEEKSIDYLDTDDGKKKSAVEHPWNVSLAGGAFLTPTVLIATSLGYKRAWSSGDSASICKNLVIGGVTTTPVTYACENLTVGGPTWKNTSTLRLEVRHYLASVVSWNPSLSYAWSGKEDGLFASPQGFWQLEVPVYVQLPAEKAGTTAFVLGTAFSHKQTWGLDKNETSDGLSVFLGGAFDIGKLL